MTLRIGAHAPPFDLPATDGTSHGVLAESNPPATVVVFTCNHCPYALAWHERIAAVARDYAEHDVVVMNINSNDAERYPRDSFEAMVARVEADPEDRPDNMQLVAEKLELILGMLRAKAQGVGGKGGTGDSGLLIDPGSSQMERLERNDSTSIMPGQS